MNIVGILGTVHGDDVSRKKLGYPIEIMRDAIMDFKPDIICGEVRPEDWEKYCNDKNYSGYLGPMEYRNLILPYCKDNDVEFFPVDWFEDDLISFDYDRFCNEEEKNKLKKEINDRYEKIFYMAKKSTIPFNSFEFNELIYEKNQWLKSVDGVVHNVNWIVRNQIMVERIRKVIENKKGKRILCTVGAEHVYFYYDELKKVDCTLIFPIK